MKTILIFVLTLLYTAVSFGVELQLLEHKVIHDNRTFLRDQADRRYSIWTDDATKANVLLAEFKIPIEDFSLPRGHILAIFLIDDLQDDITQIIYNKNTHQAFADYADSGMRLKLSRPPDGQKHAHMTVLVFKPVEHPSHLGIRSMIRDAISEYR